MQLDGKRLVADKLVVFPDRGILEGLQQQSANDGLGLVMVGLPGVLLHARDAVLVEAQARDRDGLGIQIDHVLVPLGSLILAVVHVEEIDGAAEEVLVAGAHVFGQASIGIGGGVLLALGLHLFLVGVVGPANKIDIPTVVEVGRLGDQPPLHAGLLQCLVNDPPQLEEVASGSLLLLGVEDAVPVHVKPHGDILDALLRPVDGVGIGQPPLERPPKIVDRLQFFWCHFEDFNKALPATPVLLGFRFDQVKISVTASANDAAFEYVVLCSAASIRTGVVHHLGAPGHFVESVRVIEVVADLVLKMPRQFVVQMGTMWIIF